MPLWIPDVDDRFDAQKAVQHGLSSRPLLDTARDTAVWDADRSVDSPRKAGLERAREAELLVLWKQKL